MSNGWESFAMRQLVEPEGFAEGWLLTLVARGLVGQFEADERELIFETMLDYVIPPEREMDFDPKTGRDMAP